MKRLAVLLVPLILAACASSSPTVTTESAPGTDFSQYCSFTWGAKPKAKNPLAAQRIVADINAQLQARGWTESANGDVTLVAHVATNQELTMQTFYTGTTYAGWGWQRYGGYPYRGYPYHGAGVSKVSSRTTMTTYDVGTLVLDMFDTKTKQAIWHGTVTHTLPSSAGDGYGKLDEGIVKMFAKFPPGSAAGK
ncbi:MAG: DUF4136 domain-containing protein [Gammaproteobacteria bacterium]